MMNEDLMDEKEKKIINLSLAIRSFKKYDAERKVYIAQLENRIAKLEDQLEKKTKKYENLQNIDTEQSQLQAIIEKQKKQIKEKNELITHYLNKMALMNSPEILETLSKEDIKNIASIIAMKKENKRLQHRIKLLRMSYSDLLSKTVNQQLISKDLADMIISCFPLENEDEQ